MKTTCIMRVAAVTQETLEKRCFTEYVTFFLKMRVTQSHKQGECWCRTQALESPKAAAY